MKPRLSVVIATLGRDTLVPTVESLLACTDSDSVEVVVVGTIADASQAVALHALVLKHPILKHLSLSFPRGDSSEKKNAGLRTSAADIVAFIDDDVVVAVDWANQILKPFEQPDVGMVSGPSLIPDDLPLMSRLAGCALSSLAAGYVANRYLRVGQSARKIKWSGIIGCNMAFRREVLEKAGGFDPHFWPGEEMIVSANVARQGFSIVFAPDAWLLHYPRSSFRSFVIQIYKYGATRIRLIRRGVDLEPSTLLPGILLLSVVGLGAAAYLSPWAADLLAAELLAYLVLVVIATIALFARTRRPADLLVFFMIPVMHLSYAVAQIAEVLQPDRDLSENKSPPRDDRS